MDEQMPQKICKQTNKSDDFKLHAKYKRDYSPYELGKECYSDTEQSSSDLQDLSYYYQGQNNENRKKDELGEEKIEKNEYGY
jgi:hypothetical protein